MHRSKVLQNHIHGLREIFFPVQNTDALQQGTLNIKLALHSLADVLLFRNVDGKFQPGKMPIPVDQLVSEQIMAVRNGIGNFPNIECFTVEKRIGTKRAWSIKALQDFIALFAISDVRNPEFLFSELVQIEDLVCGGIAYINDFIHFIHNNLQQALRAVSAVIGKRLRIGKKCCHAADLFTFWMTAILGRPCHRKWLMLFSLKFQKNNQQNASAIDSAKGKTEKTAFSLCCEDEAITCYGRAF
ncbi:hypothetical protein [Bilophila sp.]|uniref:hypothetical protein n=1 Tax=Bilophila sp. TaxID=1929485 RepID=UPI003076C8B9